jgi:isopenicillin N synthase-like dioxygenase
MSIINEIPIINVQNLFEKEENQVIIDQIQHACREYGFFYICNHQIDTSLINEFRQISKEFFKLSKEKKYLIKRSRENSRGYFDDELTKNIVDWKEGFDYGAQDGSLDKQGKS